MKTNLLYFGDNLPIMRDQIPSESVDLIYLDPPFNSNRNYFVIYKDRTGRASAAQTDAFADTWFWTEESERAYSEIFTRSNNHELAAMIKALREFLHETPMMSYVVSMAIRLAELHRVLKPNGSLYLHCDPTASHYLKVVLDVIFGAENFRNEITWKRTSAHNDAKKRFGNVSDTLLYYAKSEESEFSPQYIGHSLKYKTEFYKHDDKDGRGPYALDNMASPNPRPNMMYVWNGFPHPAKGWRYQEETMQQLHEDNRIYYPINENGEPDVTKRPRLKRYLLEQLGPTIGNVWTDIPPVQARGESLGYPTQKPLALLERIINASSKPGDIVFDPFCGCGTTVTAAHKLGRQWVGIDITAVAIGVIKSRLEQSFPELRGKVRIEGFPKDYESARQLFEIDPYRFQIWACTLVDAYPLTKKGADAGIDGWLNFFDYDESAHRAVVQVKGGKPTLGNVRDFCHVVAREKATLGFFLTIGEVTRAMQEEAVKQGFWTSASGISYPVIQILTISELVSGAQQPHLPQNYDKSMLGFRAKELKRSGQQGEMTI